MQFQTNPYVASYSAAEAPAAERGAFIAKTYMHLAGAIFAFVFLEAGLFVTGVANMIGPLMLANRIAWLLVMGAFIGVSYVAHNWARNATSLPMQYAGLGLYVLAEAVIFIPLIGLASMYAPEAIPQAGLITLMIFGGLTGIVFVTRKDFSFMKGALGIAAIASFAVIVCSLIFGFHLGVLFSGLMVALAGGYILYHTSNVLHHYRTDQYVSAALTLFADVALLFWYVLRILMSMSRR